ncbi:MAG: TRAM domain-containing protein [Candidatus Omnitrophica bacterium]|nr:TRAM domain-containing protein [Candidatus Omnitrophota bacterium]
MTINILRLFFLVLMTVCGYYIGSIFLPGKAHGLAAGALGGFLFSAIVIFMEARLRRVSLRNLSAGVFGLIFGFFVAWLLTLIIKLVPMGDIFYSTFQIIFTCVFCYLGMIIAIKGKDEFNIIIPYVRFSREDQDRQVFILDTSVIIDGRIVGICETGFISGKLLVPRFVLRELQQIADSSDDAKRAKGRRGLDMLNTLKKIHGIDLIVHDEELSDIKEVDAKLVRLARILDSHVITNDFNLNKIAKLEGVKVLNINDLANSLRLVVSPGEEMYVYVRKEGKEKTHGVAYLDDGTMIIVENGRRLIGKDVKVVVASVLQTSAGRMIFANPVENLGGEAPKNGGVQ